MLDYSTLSPRLAIEVIERAIDSVYEMVYEGVLFRDLYMIWKSCALTCRAMLPRSQLWLFRDIWLLSEVQALNFTKVLRGNAAVASHVRILRLGGPKDDEGGRGFTWISWVPLVYAPLMKNLQELDLAYDIFRECHPGLPQALTVFKSIRQLTLSTTSFETFGHCVRLVRAFSHLRTLSLINVSWKRNPPSSQLLRRRSQQCPQRKRVQVAHLDIVGEESSNVGVLSKWLLDAEATQSLVTFYGVAEQLGITREVACPSGSSIRSMALYGDSDLPIQGAHFPTVRICPFS